MPETTESTKPKSASRRRERDRRGKRSRRDARARKTDWRDTARFWFWAIIITLVVRAFIIEPYRIPSPSMERTLLVGDFLFVSKLNYGPRTPNTIGVPFTGFYLRGLEFPQARLPGFGSVQRGDVAVFNLPNETGPIERRTPYIKRLVAGPGDRVLILDKVLYVNDERYPLTAGQMQSWHVWPADGRVVTRAMLEEMGVLVEGMTRGQPPSFVIVATAQQAEAIAARPEVGEVEPYTLTEGVGSAGYYPSGAGFNRDHYGPLLVPGRGETIELTDANWRAYEEIIRRHEGRRIEALGEERFSIDGEEVTTYTFQQDYYFAMGDNRDNSEDSRVWGPVPHDHIVGKAVLVFFSLDLENRWLGFIPRLRLRGFEPIR